MSTRKVTVDLLWINVISWLIVNLFTLISYWLAHKQNAIEYLALQRTTTSIVVLVVSVSTVVALTVTAYLLYHNRERKEHE